MSLADHYIEFGPAILGPLLHKAVEEEAMEELRLETFENGYQAGWEDSVKAHKTEHAHAANELAQKLNDMSFTYQEAYSKLARAMKPLLQACVTATLPETSRLSLSAQINEQLDTLIGEQVHQALEIAVAPEVLPSLEGLLPRKTSHPFSIVTDPTVTAGQASLRVGETERIIDLAAINLSIQDALSAFIDNSFEEARNE